MSRRAIITHQITPHTSIAVVRRGRGYAIAIRSGDAEILLPPSVCEAAAFAFEHAGIVIDGAGRHMRTRVK